MKRDAIEKIEEMSGEDILKIGEFTFRKAGYKLVTPINKDTLTVRTLRGFVDFVNNFKTPEGEEFMIVVNDHHSVDLRGKINPIYGNRQLYCQSEININMPEFQNWRNPEEFNIFMQVFFEDKGDKKTVLDIMSKVTDGTAEETSDDGTKQDVLIRTGVKLKNNAVVPNPCTLAPKRTFPEIDQPESKFILRANNDRGVQIRLFEADGGHYKLEAIQGIKDYIKKNLGDDIKIPIIG